MVLYYLLNKYTLLKLQILYKRIVPFYTRDRFYIEDILYMDERILCFYTGEAITKYQRILRFYAKDRANTKESFASIPNTGSIPNNPLFRCQRHILEQTTSFFSSMPKEDSMPCQREILFVSIWPDFRCSHIIVYLQCRSKK